MSALPTFDEPLSMNAYQDRALTTAAFPEQGTGSALALAYCGLGLGEVGEVQGKIKKILRDDNMVVTNEKRIQIAAELGDALWYIAVTAAELGIDLDSVAMMNLEKLASRKERGVITGSGDER